ncbi:hypothetical protein O9929_21420 [Vibrio lentus]|nr:hypothetical protein [Vibrio lentus]
MDTFLTEVVAGVDWTVKDELIIYQKMVTKGTPNQYMLFSRFGIQNEASRPSYCRWLTMRC